MLRKMLQFYSAFLFVSIYYPAHGQGKDPPDSKPSIDPVRNKQLRGIYELLSGIDNAEQNLRTYADTKNDQLRAKFPQWQKEIRDCKEDLAKYDDAIKADPLLLDQAKSILTEEKRLEKIDLAKGFKHYSDEKVVAERARKLNEYIDSLKRSK